MEKLITVSDVAERYGCSRQTARKYIRQCNPHMEKPLATTQRAFNEWEADRTAYEEKWSLTDKMAKQIRADLDNLVPRRW